MRLYKNQKEANTHAALNITIPQTVQNRSQYSQYFINDSQYLPLDKSDTRGIPNVWPHGIHHHARAEWANAAYETTPFKHPSTCLSTG